MSEHALMYLSLSALAFQKYIVFCHPMKCEMKGPLNSKLWILKRGKSKFEIFIGLGNLSPSSKISYF